MEFEKILRVARKNELTKKEPVKCLQTKFKPPTKEQHDKDRMLSDGVQKFLARKEEEEKKKQMEAERRRRELMALRAKDPKANKRIQTMLKRTKSANKSVMEDAVDNNNTADTLAGPSQPDEDDYGFVSETSSALYNKLIQKMYSTPSNDVPKFAPWKKPTGGNLSNTKERVKMALLRQEEEDKLPHKRKRKGKNKDKDEDDDIPLDYSAPDRDMSTMSLEPKEKPEKPKVKKPMPPPIDFTQLLKIAEQKQHEPIVFEPKLKKVQEPEVLMTKKQKQELEKMQAWKRQRENEEKSSDEKKPIPRVPKLNQCSSDSKSSSIGKAGVENGEKSSNGQDDKKPIPKIPKIIPSNLDQKSSSLASQRKLNGHDDRLSSKNVKGQEKNDRMVPSKARDSGDKLKPRPGGSIDKKYKDDETSRLIKERDEALKILKEKEKLIRERDEAVRRLKEKEQLIRERDEAVRKLKQLEESEKVKSNSKSNLKSSDSFASKAGVGSQKLNSGKTVTKSSDALRNSSSKPDSSKPNSAFSNKNNLSKSSAKPETKSVPDKAGVRDFPPRDLKPLAKGMSREAAARNLQRSSQFPSADVRRKALALKRRRIESDDEYDSELDDFIDDDDNDIGSEDVSKVISEIFKYDKNKYSRYDDVDDECMESNFAQISKEEFFSTKCGILEDLQDIQREKAMLARKKKR